MPLYLHNSSSRAHIEDLKDRLTRQLAFVPADLHDLARGSAVISTLAGVVEAMDRGMVSERQAHEVFADFHVPGFSFDRWLTEMVDEGVYVDLASLQAA